MCYTTQEATDVRTRTGLRRTSLCSFLINLSCGYSCHGFTRETKLAWIRPTSEVLLLCPENSAFVLVYLKRSLNFAAGSAAYLLHGQGCWGLSLDIRTLLSENDVQAKKTAEVARVHQNSGQQIPGLTKQSRISSRKGEPRRARSSTHDRLTTGRSSSKPWSLSLGSEAAYAQLLQRSHENHHRDRLLHPGLRPRPQRIRNSTPLPGSWHPSPRLQSHTCRPRAGVARSACLEMPCAPMMFRVTSIQPSPEPMCSKVTCGNTTITPRGFLTTAHVGSGAPRNMSPHQNGTRC